MSEAKNDLTRELIERFGPELGLDPAGLNHLWQRLSGDKDFGLWLCRQKILSASGNALLNAAANGIEGLLEDPKRLFQDSETIANSLAALRLNSESPPDVKVARPSEPESVAETEEAWLAAIPTDPKAASPPEHEPEEAWLAAIEVLRTPAQDSIKERSLGTSDLQEADSPRRSDGSFLDAVYESIRDSQLNSSRGASGRSTIVSAKTAPPSESMPDSSIEKDSIQGPSDKKYHEPDESPPEEAWLAAITTTRSNPSSSLTRGALSYDKLYDPLKDESKARLRETPAVPESARKDGDFPTQSALPESANAQDPSMSTLLNAWDQGAGLESAGAGIEASGLASAPTVRQESGPAVAVTGQVPAPGRAPVSEAASELISAPFSPSDTDKFLRELPSGTILGRTSLKHIIGAGGMSLVFLADHLALQVPVVVKILKPSQRIKNERFYQQFIAEARLAAHIDDPAFVRIFDCGYERGLAFIVLELIDGEPLNEAWGRRDLREPRKIVELIHKAAQSLAMAHRRSIVHRDVKPHNFFLTRSGEIKLGDFGLARLRADDPSAELDAGGQSALGTPHYVAPEQILNFAQADERSDQYSLGVMLFEALAGRVPFAGRTLIDILKAQLHEPPPLNFLPKDTPRSLRSCVERCLQKDPMKRFQTDDELISALELVLRDLDPSVRATTRFLRGLRKLVGGDPDSP